MTSYWSLDTYPLQVQRASGKTHDAGQLFFEWEDDRIALGARRFIISFFPATRF